VDTATTGEQEILQPQQTSTGFCSFEEGKDLCQGEGFIEKQWSSPTGDGTSYEICY
jgi:hypothetical protein